MPIRCTCGRHFDTDHSFQLHMDLEEYGHLTYKCSRICGRAFRTEVDLVHHQRVAPLHHMLHRFVRWDPSANKEFLFCEECDREFNNITSLYQHLRHNLRHLMAEGQLLPYGYGERPSLQSTMAESLTRTQLQIEEQRQQEPPQLTINGTLRIQQVGHASSTSIALPNAVLQHPQSSILQNIPEPPRSTASFSSTFLVPTVPAPNVRVPSFQVSFQVPNGQISTFQIPNNQISNVQIPNIQIPNVQFPTVRVSINQVPDVQAPNNRVPIVRAPTVQVSTFRAPNNQVPNNQVPTNVIPASPSLQNPSVDTSMPADTGADDLDVMIRNLSLDDTTATSHTPDPTTRPRSNSEQRRENLGGRKVLVPVSQVERMAKARLKWPVFGPPTLQEELIAMSAKMADLESELNAAKDTIKLKESQRECSMCYERDVNSVTKCGHQFCDVCIDSWQSQHRSSWQSPCPVCRKPMGQAIRVYYD